MTTTVINDLAQLEAALKTDLLQTLGTPVLTLLQTEQTALTQPGVQGVAALQSGWLVFLGQVPLALPQLGVEGLQALNSFAIAKLQSLMAPPATAAAVAKPA